MPSSPSTKVGGNGAASTNNLTMISGPIPQPSPMVIAIGKCSQLDILFYFHKCACDGSLAAKATSFCHQWKRVLPKDSHNGNACFHFAQDFKGLRPQGIT